MIFPVDYSENMVLMSKLGYFSIVISMLFISMTAIVAPNSIELS